MRTKPRKPRNCYRDRTWLAAVHRAWRQRANLPDLDSLFATAMKEPDPMPNYVTCEITILGRKRPLRLPRFGPLDTTAAFDHLRYWRDHDEVSEAVAQQAATVLEAIAQVGRAP